MLAALEMVGTHVIKLCRNVNVSSTKDFRPTESHNRFDLLWTKPHSEV